MVPRYQKSLNQARRRLVMIYRNLLDHQITNSREKPFKCDQFNKTFIQVTILISHLRTHIGEKPFKYVHCTKDLPT